MRKRSAGAWRAAAPGFTLLELLVAISILAVIAVVSWRGVASLAATRERLEPRNNEVHAMLAGLGQIERDLGQAPTSAAMFALAVPAVQVLTIDGHVGLRILRLAPSSDGNGAAAAQTILYQVRDGALVRQSTPPQRLLTAAVNFADAGVVLVPGIDDLQIRVWRDNVGWVAPVSDADTVLAVGVEVVLLRHGGTRLRGVFAIG